MAQINTEKLKFQQLLPMYVNGSLEQEDVQFVDGYLKKHPEMKHYLTLNQAIKLAIKSEPDVDIYNAELAWEKLHAGIKNTTKKTPWKLDFNQPWLSEWLFSIRKWGVVSPAFGVIFALFIGQSIYMLNIPNEANKYRGISNSINLAPHFKVTVNPKADFYALADLIRKNGGSVVSGPSQNGEIWIKLDDPSKSKQIKADMLNSGLVDEVISVSDEVE